MESERTIGEKSSILVGRTMENQKRSLGVRPESSAERRFGLPVSSRSRLVLEARMAGAYVSFMRNQVLTIITPVWWMSVGLREGNCETYGNSDDPEVPAPA